MPNNWTAQQIANYDQNMASVHSSLDKIVTDWQQHSIRACCTEHAVLNMSSHVVEEVNRLGPIPVALMLIAAAQRLDAS
jgi:hypothetical protein